MCCMYLHYFNVRCFWTAVVEIEISRQIFRVLVEYLAKMKFARLLFFAQARQSFEAHKFCGRESADVPSTANCKRATALHAEYSSTVA